jgi:DNA-binding transcriptional MerR regulator
MEYSITSLAKQARISVRTLRHYDHVGLLKPSIRMTSGRRIYDDEQFLRLFEIIFFKKIGLSLSKIKELFLTKTYHKAVTSVLMRRRQELAKEIKRLQRHANSIDMTIPYYKNCTLSQKERLDKFQSLQNTMKQVEELQFKEFGKEKIEKGKEKFDALSEEQIEERADRSNKLMKDAIKAIERGLKPDSREIQEVMKRYYDLLTEFNPATKEVFLKLRDIILEHREAYASYHPNMPEFLYKAMSVFAEGFFDDEHRDES